MIDAAPFIAWVNQRVASLADEHSLQTEGGSARPADGWKILGEKIGMSGDWLRKGQFRRSGLIDQATVEDVFTACDVAIWEHYEPGAYDDGGPVHRRPGKPIGVHGRMSEAQVRAAHVLYDEGGYSLRGLADLLWESVGYPNAHACSNALSGYFIRYGLPRRDRVAATQAASVKHGRARRKAYRVDPDDYAAYRAEMRRASGEVRGVMCAGVREQYPRKGAPCENHALAGSDYCRSHDDRYREQVALNLADARMTIPTNTEA